jgi:hypothetical protein
MRVVGKESSAIGASLTRQDESTCSSSLLSENWHPLRYPCHQFRNQQAILQMCLGNPRYGLSRCSFWFSIISLGCSEPPATRMHVNTACHHASVYPSSDRFCVFLNVTLAIYDVVGLDTHPIGPVVRSHPHVVSQSPGFRFG